MRRHRSFLGLWVLFVCAGVAGCGSVGSNAGTNTTPTLSTQPQTVTLRAGGTQQFSAQLNGTTTTAVTWTVLGGAANGTVDGSGLFTAPATVPTPNIATVQATSTTNGTLMGASQVTLNNPVPVVSSVNPSTIGVGTVGVTVNGSNFVSGATVLFGGTALTPTVASSTQLTVTVTTTAAQVGQVAVQVQNPNPGQVTSTTSVMATVTTGNLVTPAAAARFLEQSTFGPTAGMISQVEQIGFPAFLNNQFGASGSTYADPATGAALLPTQQTLFTNALSNPDQLRQRMVLVLSEIWVTSGLTVPVQGVAPYMRLLLGDAFADYRQLMFDVTLSPAMGDYLNMVNNKKPPTGQHANENYARELMQLFTLGLNQINEDGSLKLDSSGNLIPTYNQNQVEALALAFTGWTYAASTQQWISPMVAVDTNHDMTAKTLLPVNGTTVTLPPSQTSLQDLNGALDNIFAQPSLSPFVSKQLIQHLVTSNPSPAYIQRIASAFDTGRFSGYGATFGSGTRGNMQAVIAAILLDPEARRGDDPTTANASDGHLREPILFITGILRAFGATSDGLAPTSGATGAAAQGQNPLDAPSVFNFFPPDYNIAGTNLLGPEFDLDTTATTLVRINFVNSFVYGSIGTGTTVDFTSWANLSANPNASGQLIDSLNGLLLHGSLSSSSRAAIVTAVNAVPGPAGSTQNLARAKAAIYLILSSSQYQVEQ